MPAAGDSVFATLKTENDCPVGETNSAERLYRGVVATPGEWAVGDTLILQLPGSSTCRLFGSADSELNTPPILLDSGGNPVGFTVTGQGTRTLTLTLTETAPDNETLTVCSRTGIPGAYVRMSRNISGSLMRHVVVLETNYFEVVYGYTSAWGSTATVGGALKIDGESLQTNPAT